MVPVRTKAGHFCLLPANHFGIVTLIVDRECSRANRVRFTIRLKLDKDAPVPTFYN
jgi:hypothetical protein